MKYEKKCKHCRNVFIKPPRMELSRWFGRPGNPYGRIFCSFNCYKKSLKYTVPNAFKHGKRNSRLYATWDNMRRRCNIPSHPSYKDYGGRGIKVCKEWNKSFKAFYEWGKCFENAKEYSLDRIDNNKGYSPRNCRWATRSEQQRNMRSALKITAFGQTKSIYDWVNDPRCKTTIASLRWRYIKKWPSKLAITLPKNSKLICLKRQSQANPLI